MCMCISKREGESSKDRPLVGNCTCVHARAHTHTDTHRTSSGVDVVNKEHLYLSKHAKVGLYWVWRATRTSVFGACVLQKTNGV